MNQSRRCRLNDCDSNELVNQLKRPGIHDGKPPNSRKMQDMDMDNRFSGNNSQELQTSGAYDIYIQTHSNTCTWHMKKNVQTKSDFLLKCTVLIVIFGIAVEYLSPPFIPEERSFWQFRQSIKVLREIFPNQTDNFWKASLAAAKPVLLQKMPKKPGVILIAGPNRSKELSQCLAQRLSEAMNNAFEIKTPVVTFDSSKFKNSEADEVENQLNNKFLIAFANGTKVGIIEAIEALPGNSSMVIYKLCATENAQHRKVIIILIFNMEKEVTIEKEGELDELKQLWASQLDKDHIEPLFSRIENIVYVRPDQHNC